MSKRFTDTDRWKKGLLRGLQAPYKLLWLYINDECNHAGIWVVDWDVAMIRTGLTKITFEQAKSAFAGFIKDLGDEWFLPSFIDEQYGCALNPENKVHASVIKILRAKNVFDESFLADSIRREGEVEAPWKGLEKPLQGAKNKNKEIDKDRDKVNKESKNTERAREKKKPILFSESEVSDLKVFQESFVGTEYEAFNLEYYYQSLLNWSEAESKRKIDWVATARSWMLRDVKDGKAAMKNQNLMSNGRQSNSKTGQPITGANVDTNSAFSKIAAIAGGTGK